MTTLSLAATLIALQASSLTVTQMPQTAQAWATAARKDVEAAYQLTKENHPGIYDPQNPGFILQLDKARDDAIAMSQQVTEANGYMAVIAKFSTLLQDGHAGAFNTLPESFTTIRWPGFNASWRGNGLWVFRSDLPEVPKGAQILACDGIAIEDLIKQRVFQYRGLQDVPGQWWSLAGDVMTDNQNPFLNPLNACEIRINGNTKKIRLQWTVRPEEGWQWRRESKFGDRLPIGMRWITPEMAWIALPNFTPDQDQIKLYEQMLDQIKSEREKLRQSRMIVIDLRHNQGGYGSWAVRTAQALWGESVFERLKASYFAETRTWRRASIQNVEAMELEPEAMIKRGMPEYVEYVRWLAKGLRTAYNNGEPFYIEGNEKTPLPKGLTRNQAMQIALQPQAGDLPQLTTPVWVIVPGDCASSCLDAIDYFKFFPNTKLIGAPSSVDSTYMEVRYQPTASGMTKVILPGKIVVNRPRKNGDYYSPDVLHSDLDWSTQSFEKHLKAIAETRN